MLDVNWRDREQRKYLGMMGTFTLDLNKRITKICTEVGHNKFEFEITLQIAKIGFVNWDKSSALNSLESLHKCKK